MHYHRLYAHLVLTALMGAKTEAEQYPSPSFLVFFQGFHCPLGEGPALAVENPTFGECYAASSKPLSPGEVIPPVGSVQFWTDDTTQAVQLSGYSSSDGQCGNQILSGTGVEPCISADPADITAFKLLPPVTSTTQEGLEARSHQKAPCPVLVTLLKVEQSLYWINMTSVAKTKDLNLAFKDGGIKSARKYMLANYDGSAPLLKKGYPWDDQLDGQKVPL